MKNAKNHFIETKIYKLILISDTHQTLFQHQLASVWPTI